jgi:HlyD family secretion protein
MTQDIRQVLGLLQTKAQLRSGPRRWLILAAGLLVILLLAWWLSRGGNDVGYEYAEAKQGDLTVTVTATGVLQPVNQVDVGTEISGTVRSVEVDFNDHVTQGQVLARLDTDQLAARVRQSEAMLALAQASVKENQATEKETASKLRRSRELLSKGLSTPDQIDTAQAAHDRAAATLARAQAQVTQSDAQLDADRTALSKAVIVSPINGIVLKRQIEPGQTVAASLQTPVLFTLAESLAQMELNVAVDEADVGKVKEGQAAIFTVDAYTEKRFPASIAQVRFAPQTIDGVVTYETVLNVDNSSQLLRPGMTATADITVQELKDVLLVPNGALRFKPPKKEGKQSQNIFTGMFSRRPDSSKEKQTDAGKSRMQRVWILDGNTPKSIKVKTGPTDGTMTQVFSEEIKPGMELIIDMQKKTK